MNPRAFAFSTLFPSRARPALPACRSHAISLRAQRSLRLNVVLLFREFRGFVLSWVSWFREFRGREFRGCEFRG